eukprot:gene17688-21092_t
MLTSLRLGTPPPSISQTGHFPFPNSTTGSASVVSWENAVLKDMDAVTIRQPNGTLSVGFNEKKFTHHIASTGEHNPAGLYAGMADPDILIQQQNRLESGVPDGVASLYDGTYNFEAYRRKKV